MAFSPLGKELSFAIGLSPLLSEDLTASFHIIGSVLLGSAAVELSFFPKQAHTCLTLVYDLTY